MWNLLYIGMTKVTKYNGNVNKQTDVYAARKQEEREKGEEGGTET